MKILKAVAAIVANQSPAKVELWKRQLKVTLQVVAVLCFLLNTLFSLTYVADPMGPTASAICAFLFNVVALLLTLALIYMDGDLRDLAFRTESETVNPLHRQHRD